MPTNLIASSEGRVLHLTLDRPEKRNALLIVDCADLVAALNEAELDDGVGAVLLDASGDCFCSGMDLTESLREDAPERAAIHHELFTIGARITKPVIAAVQGKALAGGVGLVANAHIVVAADDASLGLTEIRLALWPYVVFRAVASAIGERRALELSLTGRLITAQEALQWGLIHHIAPSGELSARAFAIASRVSSFSPEAVRRGLDFVHRSRTLSPPETVEFADARRRRSFASDDFAEGVNAFFEKREPKWPSLSGEKQTL